MGMVALSMKIEILASSSKGNAYIIRDGAHSILIDPGLPIAELKKRSNFTLSSIELCLVSHEHLDHCRAIHDLNKIGIPMAMSLGTAKHCGLIFTQILILESEKEFNFNAWSVLPFATQHDAAEPLGFLIKTPSGQKICYATDTYYIRYNFMGVTHWMVECNYSRELLKQNRELPQITKDRIVTSHFELSNVKSFFKAQDLSKTKEIHLIHLSDENSNPKQFVSDIEQITGLPVYANL